MPNKSDAEPENRPTSVERLSVANLVLWTLGFSLFLAVPAYLMVGPQALSGLSLAAFLCLVPGWLVFLLYSRYGDPSQVTVGFLIGSGIRLAIVLGGFVAVDKSNLFSSRLEFVPWLGILFLFTLIIETRLLLKFISSVNKNSVQSR
ncbi:MAG: hypothetical protein KDA65_14295 [Planctomycetaceae bacterium]|nr:hypothetical protein [Planctomycetaceae bacterium]